MCMLLCVILSVKVCFYHLSSGSVWFFVWFFILVCLYSSSFTSELCGWQGLGVPAGVRPEPPRWEG